ncbi:UDP-N-acetylmuramoylalanyl-D-glutamate--2, 6-diaminopimelate ligase [Candidatus Endolissoclinum faulkneri L5]|uniref:UDP-N-acetylmuramoyl-L-alanyl-D-glutamate--2,6-diaminopimelate ligase n=1 Tax=Candidatus Endolissoclinum faulkneri L5 TaxID=1401328 RepID=V9TUN1_9PROT|nr:UDP-N-acetylmuramoyl-L-alanyl-D-glutamate--2,6-diaminopimelate ligase [Candidatus Endolissoclinum faulkneri]AHC73857.1 UDP-N-acetylmuramoylalanyl-D-glutamate--2, 6-diaminopimelate ligase [Candidatus Endolissoclinum faulkneri L5]
MVLNFNSIYDLIYLNAGGRALRLSALINYQDLSSIALISEDPEILGLTTDSRKIQPGFLFAAIPGSRVDGRNYIPEAIANGAVVVLTTPNIIECAVGILRDKNPRRQLALIAARFYGKQPKICVAVTGTNGKTSVADFTRQIWNSAGYLAASIGTLGITIEDIITNPNLTTPDAVELHRTLHNLVQININHAVLEASSHGLDQSRLDGVDIKAAAFTNLTRDHFDYHVNIEDYRTAKLSLFEKVMPPGGTAVINIDSPEFNNFCEAAKHNQHKILSYGMRPSARLRIIRQRIQSNGQEVEITIDGNYYLIKMALLGNFQAWNALCALGLAISSGTPIRLALEALPFLTSVRGRLERVAVLENEATIYVDYAHTSDALRTVLQAMRPHTSGKLWCILGCGGDRDPGKRSIMGATAGEYADRTIITDDNPRSEDPASIRAAILAACKNGVEIADRRTAIYETIAQLDTGDVLIIAGKGHENVQEINGIKYSLNESYIVRDAIAAQKYLG